MLEKPKYWMGGEPSVKGPCKCDICQKVVEDAFVDGKTTMGPWANMCLTCHTVNGVGIGTGQGQKYERQEDKRWLKTGG